MIKYTQDQLLAMTNEQLDEIVALAQGWVLVHGVWRESLYIHADVFPNYHPSTNKEQMVDLMLLCRLSSENIEGYGWKVSKVDLIHFDGYVTRFSVADEDLLVAVTIASILHLQESE